MEIPEPLLTRPATSIGAVSSEEQPALTRMSRFRKLGKRPKTKGDGASDSVGSTPTTYEDPLEEVGEQERLKAKADKTKASFDDANMGDLHQENLVKQKEIRKYFGWM
jgi:hypothetical protein